MSNFEKYKIKPEEPDEEDEGEKTDNEFARLLEERGMKGFEEAVKEKEKGEIQEGKNKKLFNKKEVKNIQDSLDLHGQSKAEAKISIESFIADCRRRGLSVVQIITGKGEWIINQHTKGLLDNMKRNNVIKEYKTAPGNLGGEGALIVILK